MELFIFRFISIPLLNVKFKLLLIEIFRIKIPMEKEYMDKIDKEWSNKRKVSKSRWWMVPSILRHVNEIVCGEPLEGVSSGLNYKLKKLGFKFEHGVSVGFGNGSKEFKLMEEGIVNKFTLFELSEERIKIASDNADLQGLSDRVEFIKGDYYIHKFDEDVDFVHWNNSLHHMINVEKAIKWSFEILINGGVFYMDDFVGPSKFQWADAQLQLATRIRQTLPDIYLKNRRKPGKMLDRTISQPNAQDIEKADPSEAADSSAILDNIKKYFPNADINLTGGCVYHTALNDILCNIDESDEKDKTILDLLLIIDELATKSGVETQYATVLAIKNDNILKLISRKIRGL